MQRNTILAAKVLTVSAVIPAFILAHSTGPEPRRTGAPGDETCTKCHIGTANSGGGSVEITAAGGTTYTPGQRQRLRVTITNASPGARSVNGFQASARLNSNRERGQAGTLHPVDGETFVQCEDAATSLPCRDTAIVQFIQHTLAKAGNSYEFEWTPPASADAGPVTIYVAGNAANGNGQETGDRIFTNSITLTPSAPTGGGPRPAIQSENGVINGATFAAGIVSGSWVTIKGENLAPATRIWLDADFTNGQAPTQLDGVRVNIDGKPAAVYFISPGQVNVQAPALDKTGPVTVEVINANGTSNTASGDVRRAAPGWFMFDPENRKYIAGTHVDGTFLGKSGLFGTAVATRAAKPGDIIVLYGANFGPTNPPLPIGRGVTVESRLVETPNVTIGGVRATVLYGGGAPSFIGTYQFNITVPDVPNGDHQVVVEVGGVRTQENACITIQR
ncbi:MAG TPA: choice-of-anchor V domain-containing protein [Bryobacteraceae bacterium]|nr:choice-of-anchor V domain-containing protein [Bryobacteraceae bacterium]